LFQAFKYRRFFRRCHRKRRRQRAVLHAGASGQAASEPLHAGHQPRRQLSAKLSHHQCEDRRKDQHEVRQVNRQLNYSVRHLI